MPEARAVGRRDDPHAPLRADIRLLGDTLGDVIRSQAGDEVFQAVERVRAFSKKGRAGDEDAQDQLQKALRELPIDQAVPVARGFAHFLRLSNIAEQHHRIRRRRDHERDSASGPQRGSLADSFGRLLAAGVDPKEMWRRVCDMHVELVLTAHPTEITRRTVLAKHQRLADLLSDLDHDDLTPPERGRLETTLRREVLALWETDELRRDRPTPEDEARGGYAVIEKVLWDAIPEFLRNLDAQLKEAAGVGLPVDAAPITIGSWMGGDRDGNPNVTPETTRRVVLLARWMAADLYVREINALRDELSVRSATQELRDRAGDDPEPYRAVLRQARDRLEATRDRIEMLLDGGVPQDRPFYQTTAELAEPLELCRGSLAASGMKELADGRLLDILRRLAVFGLHLVRIDLRQEASRHTEALDAITRHLGAGSYAEWDEDERREWLVQALEAPEPAALDGLNASEPVEDVLETCRVATALPRENLGAYVISMAAAPSDVLAAEYLQRVTGADRPLRVVPLFETLDDLTNAGASVRALLDIPSYRKRVVDAGLEVMVGYSDSAKDAGLLAASWALYRAQEELVAACDEAGVSLTIFHGRGGTVGRGGGPAHAAIGSLPPGSVEGTLRVTEQGEVIQSRFGLPGIALRSLELYATAVLEATLDPPPEPSDAWRDLMDAMAGAARDAYRGVLATDGFVDYFRAATPETEISRLNIGSRPAHRGQDGGLDTLRAIPWVFAWTQNRLILPGWLGVGEGLAAGRQRDADGLAGMVRSWPFLASTLDQVEMVLAKADAWVSGRYDQDLVPAALRPLGDQLRKRYGHTVEEVKRCLGRKDLLEANPVLKRSIRVRNPYVDPLNVLQVEFLRRLRHEDDDAIRRALHLTINGVAQGMRNTG